MPPLRLYLFDDPVAREWAPFAATRPVGELLFGALLLRERAERSAGAAARGYLRSEGMEGFAERGAPPILPAEALPRNAPLLLLSTRYTPPLSDGGLLPVLFEAVGTEPTEPVRLEVEGEAVGWILPAGSELEPSAAPPGPDRSGLLPGSGMSGHRAARALEVPGRLLFAPWDLVDHNAAQLAHDLPLLFGSERSSDVRPLPELPGVERIGSEPVTAEADVTVDPGAVMDSRSGPIHLERGVRIRPFTLLRGPAFVGRGSTLLGGVFESVSCGPVCKLRGEVEASVVLGYSNKAHDGYLGHSLLGRWVNLGAFTTNSDLKNNYGTIRVEGPSGAIDTGLLKVGVFLGDHVKTGIGTLMNAGTIIGAGTNIFGGGMPLKHVRPFSWGSGAELGVHRKEAFLDTAERAMGRRGVPLSPEQRRFLTSLWNRVHGGDTEDADR